MDATICVRCGLPNKPFRILLLRNLLQRLSIGRSEINCVRCGLPNTQFQDYLQGRYSPTTIIRSGGVGA